MKTRKYIIYIVLLIIFVLLYQNIKLHKLLNIASDIADESVQINNSRLEYILEHFDNDVNDSTINFLQCAEIIRNNHCVSKEQEYSLQEYAPAVLLSDSEKSAMLWSIKNARLFPQRFHIISLLENSIINRELDYFFSTRTFVNYGGRVICIAPKDTLNYGESYEADLKFVLRDTSVYSTYMVSAEEIRSEDDFQKVRVDTLKDGHFQMTAQKKGDNVIYGIYKLERYRNTSFYSFQMNYYVK